MRHILKIELAAWLNLSAEQFKKVALQFDDYLLRSTKDTRAIARNLAKIIHRFNKQIHFLNYIKKQINAMRADEGDASIENKFILLLDTNFTVCRSALAEVGTLSKSDDLTDLKAKQLQAVILEDATRIGADTKNFSLEMIEQYSLSIIDEESAIKEANCTFPGLITNEMKMLLENTEKELLRTYTHLTEFKANPSNFFHENKPIEKMQKRKLLKLDKELSVESSPRIPWR